MRTPGHRARTIASSSALAVLTLAGLAAAGARVTTSQASTPVPVRPVEARPVSHPSSNGPIKVAVVLGASGTVGSDALAPYEVFAGSPQFSVYTVAATATAQATQGGPAIVPTFTFADTESGRAPRPDVVVVPAVAHADGPTEAPMRAWLAERADEGVRVLSVCNGAEVLAAAGLLDGRTATAHWSRLGAYAKRYPDVHWVAGKRFVQDGSITSTAGVTSGIPGALRVMADVAGDDEANRVGRLVGYPSWSLTRSPDIPTQSFARADLPVGLNALLPWGRPTLGIVLSDGIGEIDVASSFEVYDVSYAARPIPLSVTGTVTTMHGIVLLTNTVADDPTPTTLAVPGPAGTANLDPTLKAWAKRHQVPVEAVHGPDSSPGFDGALRYLSGYAGRATAVSAAKMIDYPTPWLRLDDAGDSVRIPLLGGLTLVLAAAAATVPTLVRRARRTSSTRRGRSPGPASAPPHRRKQPASQP